VVAFVVFGHCRHPVDHRRPKKSGVIAQNLPQLSDQVLMVATLSVQPRDATQSTQSNMQTRPPKEQASTLDLANRFQVKEKWGNPTSSTTT